MVLADTKTLSSETQNTLIFIYGTLKKDFPNHHYFEEVINQKEATFLGTCTTKQPCPLIIGPYGTPYMLCLLNNGQRVRGELYSVSALGVARLDELEETSVGHYERLPIQVLLENSENGGQVQVVLGDAEVYFAHWSFGEKMWEKSGKVGLSEYSQHFAEEYVKQLEYRPKVNSFLDDIQLFLSCWATDHA